MTTAAFIRRRALAEPTPSPRGHTPTTRAGIATPMPSVTGGPIALDPSRLILRSLPACPVRLLAASLPLRLSVVCPVSTSPVSCPSPPLIASICSVYWRLLSPRVHSLVQASPPPPLLGPPPRPLLSSYPSLAYPESPSKPFSFPPNAPSPAQASQFLAASCLLPLFLALSPTLHSRRMLRLCERPPPLLVSP